MYMTKLHVRWTTGARLALGFCSAMLAVQIARAQMPLPAAKPPDGATLFKQQCATCHTSNATDPVRQGPSLYKVVGRHAGQACRAAPARGAQGYRLGLIAGMMGQQQVEDTGFAARIFEERVAGFARRGLDPGHGLGPGPGQKAGRDGMLSKPGTGQSGVVGRPGTQAVVDNQRQEPTMAGFGPRPGEECQGHAVGSARDRDGHERAGLERPHGVEPVRELLGAERCERVSRSRRRSAHGSAPGGSVPGRRGDAAPARRRSGRRARDRPWPPAPRRA